MRALLALALLSSSCLFSQSQNCGEAYERHLTRFQSGRYVVSQPVVAGDPLAGVHTLDLRRDNEERETLVVTTDDGRSAAYHLIR